MESLAAEDGRLNEALADHLKASENRSSISPMSVTEILEELPRLLPADRVKVSRYLRELEMLEKEETPEMIAAIDSGRRSIREGKTHSVEQARELIAQWTTQ